MTVSCRLFRGPLRLFEFVLKTIFFRHAPRCPGMVVLLSALLGVAGISCDRLGTNARTSLPSVPAKNDEMQPDADGIAPVSGQPLTAMETSPATELIRGEVRDQSGRPMPSIPVLPLPFGGEPVATDANGRFEIPASSKDGYFVLQLVARDEEHNLAAMMDVPEDYNPSVRITLEPAVTLRGRVIDSAGNPIKRAKVWATILGAKIRPDVIRSPDGYAYQLAYKQGDVGFGRTVFPPSDDEGRFEIKALPVRREYRVGANPKGYGRDWLDTSLIVEPGVRTLDDLVIKPANRSISGIVLDGKRKPVPGVRVQASGEFQPRVTATTDAAGRFRIDGICEGQVSLSAKAPNELWLPDRCESRAGESGVELYLKEKPARADGGEPREP